MATTLLLPAPGLSLRGTCLLAPVLALVAALPRPAAAQAVPDEDAAKAPAGDAESAPAPRGDAVRAPAPAGDATAAPAPAGDAAAPPAPEARRPVVPEFREPPGSPREPERWELRESPLASDCLFPSLELIGGVAAYFAAVELTMYGFAATEPPVELALFLWLTLPAVASASAMYGIGLGSAEYRPGPYWAVLAGGVLPSAAVAALFIGAYDPGDQTDDGTGLALAMQLGTTLSVLMTIPTQLALVIAMRTRRPPPRGYSPAPPAVSVAIDPPAGPGASPGTRVTVSLPF